VKKRKFFNPPGLELRPLGRPARNQPLYLLSYPGFLWLFRIKIKYIKPPYEYLVKTYNKFEYNILLNIVFIMVTPVLCLVPPCVQQTEWKPIMKVNVPSFQGKPSLSFHVTTLQLSHFISNQVTYKQILDCLD
jgi:hypothetical protein